MNDMNQKFFDRPYVLPAIIFGIFLIGGMWVLGTAIANRGADSTIVVTGSTVEPVRSDQATWRIELRRSSDAFGTATGYSQLSRDVTVVHDYFTNLHLASSTITGSVISTDEDYRQDSNAPKTYTLRETLTIQTNDVDRIDQLSRSLSEVNAKIAPDTRLAPQQPEYYISQLPGLRVSLLGRAIADARARAMQIAKSGGTTVGALKSASSGVVQVMAPNSTNVEDYGTYDTSTIQKQVMVSARVTFYTK